MFLLLLFPAGTGEGDLDLSLFELDDSAMVRCSIKDMTKRTVN